MTHQPPMIYQALAKVKRGMPAVPRNHETTSGPKYQYRAAEDVVNAAAPLLDEHGIIPAIRVEKHTRELREDKSGRAMAFSLLEVSVTFYTEDGSFLETRVIGEASDVSDKASTKAQTVAYRIALCGVLNIATAETTISPEAGSQSESASDSAVIRATTAMRSARDPEAFKKVISYVLKCGAGKGKPADTMNAESMEELRGVAHETIARLRLNEEASQWIDDRFAEVISGAGRESVSEDVPAVVRETTMDEVMATIKDPDPEQAMRQLAGVWNGVSVQNRSDVLTTLHEITHPAFKSFVQIERSESRAALSGEHRSVTALAASGLIQEETKAVLLKRVQERLNGFGKA